MMNDQGIDYDLEACLQYNPQQFAIDDIARVLAVWEGQNEGDDWRWVLQLKHERGALGFVFLQGGCDYTGWDCQSWTVTRFGATAERAAKAGMTHMLSVLRGNMSHAQEVYQSLLQQIRDGNKSQTWRESMDDEMLGDNN
jgi:hypothetical protein